MRAIPADDTFRDVQNLIRSVVHSIWKRQGGDFDEMFQEACLAFMSAYRFYDPKRGAFSTLLVTCVRNHLTNYVKKRYRSSHIQLDDPSKIQCLDFDLEIFFRSLSDDAETVLRLVFETPEEIALIARQRGGHGKNWRSAIKDHLKEIGWTTRRIQESFNEIKGLL